MCEDQGRTVRQLDHTVFFLSGFRCAIDFASFFFCAMITSGGLSRRPVYLRETETGMHRKKKKKGKCAISVRYPLNAKLNTYATTHTVPFLWLVLKTIFILHWIIDLKLCGKEKVKFAADRPSIIQLGGGQSVSSDMHGSSLVGFFVLFL